MTLMVRRNDSQIDKYSQNYKAHGRDSCTVQYMIHLNACLTYIFNVIQITK